MSRGLLLDTHALFWLDTDPDRLPAATLNRIRNRATSVYVSAMTAWELAIKYALGKLPEAGPLLRRYHQTLADYDFDELAFTGAHALLAGSLRSANRDPFDRALAAQAIREQLLLVSKDPGLMRFEGVRTSW